MRPLSRFYVHLRRLIRQPSGELSRAQRTLKYLVDLCRHGWRQLQKDQAPQMAAALTYRTIFSLVPIVVLSMFVFRAFYPLEDAQRWARSGLYDYLGWDALDLQRAQAAYEKAVAEEDDRRQSTKPLSEPIDAPPAELPGGDASSSAAASAQETVDRNALISKIDDLIERVWDMNFADIGVIGLALFIWAALALMVEIETAFNVIFDCPGRSWYSRVTTYWAIITLGPLLVFGSLYGAEFLVDFVHQKGLLSWLAGLTATWFMLFAFYLMIPNTRVRMKPALVGAFVSALAWEIGKWLFTWYVVSTVPYSVLYGSLGVIPLFLFWLYINWLIILFGLELAATVQHMPGRMLAEQEHSQHRDRVLCDPQVVLPLMTLVGESFRAGRARSVVDLARKLKLPVDVVSNLCLKLEQNGLLNRVESGRGAAVQFALARPPECISIPRLLELGRAFTTGRTRVKHKLPGGEFLNQLAAVQSAAIEHATLATVLGDDHSATADGSDEPAVAATFPISPAAR